MTQEAFCYPVSQLVDGKWVDFPSQELGKVRDGIGFTDNKRLLDLGDGRLVNEATGDVFYQTAKDKEKGKFQKFFNREKKILVNVYGREDLGDDWYRG